MNPFFPYLLGESQPYDSWERELDSWRQQVYETSENSFDRPRHEEVAAASQEVEPVGSGRGPLARDWCFTWNNPGMLDTPEEWSGVKYLRYQLERGENGTNHYQGFVQFKVKKRLSALKKLAPPVHWEVRRGTVQQAIDYVEKEESRVDGPWGFGDPSIQGERSDLTVLAEKVLSGVSLKLIARENPSHYVRYAKGLQALARYAPQPPLVRDVTVKLFFGPTGTGKTWTAVHSLEDPDEVYIKDTGQWWDNYHGQKLIVVDDFAGKASSMRLVEVLRMLDGYRYQVQVKGGYEWLGAETIIVTTNIHPKDWYKWDGREDQYPALRRRFHEVWVFATRDSHTLAGADFW